jgi:hypothetical protein
MWVSLQVVAYEVLLRRLIRRAPNAALLAFEGFNFASYDSATTSSKAVQLPAPYYNTGAITARRSSNSADFLKTAAAVSSVRTRVGMEYRHCTSACAQQVQMPHAEMQFQSQCVLEGCNSLQMFEI